MKNGFSLCCLLIGIAIGFVFICSAASAADKVVVIPLNSSSPPPVNDPCELSCEKCTERPFPLKDSSGNLIANCRKDCDAKYYDCVSSTGYKFDYYGNYNRSAVEIDGKNKWNFDTTLYIGSLDISYFPDRDSMKTKLYYDNSNCTGTVYAVYRGYKTTAQDDCYNLSNIPATHEYINYFDDWISESSAKGEGRIYGRVSGDGGKVYYVAPFTKYILLNNAYKWGFESIGGGVYQCVCENVGETTVYPIYENDPSVTGFQNTYNISPARTWWRNYHNFHY